jgi:release factor glutamine methyltransferase
LGKSELNTIRGLLKKGTSLLSKKVAASAIEAKVLLMEAAGLSEVEFLASPEREITAKDQRRFRRLIQKRLSGMPLAYILGRKEFWSMTLRVGPGVIIPRPETELLVEKTLELCVDRRPTIVDIGTGSGNTALALARELPQARIIAADISTRALSFARLNAQSLGLEKVTFVQGNLFSALRGVGLEGKCDFVVSNPPYVSASDWGSISPEVKNHEPRRAFYGGKTGLDFIRRLIKGAPTYLKPGGRLLFEIGFGQSKAAKSLLSPGWIEVNSFADLRGIPRVITAKRA